MHTDSSLDVLDNVTTAFGQHMRHFAEETCAAFDTFETDKEQGARARAEAGCRKKCGTAAASASTPAVAPGKRRKGYNLMTSKLHALGDYVHQIKLLGTIDSFTTQIVSRAFSKMTHQANQIKQGELQHRLVKAWNE